MRLKRFLDRLDRDRIVRAIQAAESRSRGEIRVHASNRAVVDVQKAAVAQFERLGMAGTAEGTGVLIFMAPLSRNFAVLGDHGIHAKCGDAFWAAVVAEMSPLLKAGKFTEAILEAIRQAGDALAKHFPPERGDSNELPNALMRD